MNNYDTEVLDILEKHSIKLQGAEIIRFKNENIKKAYCCATCTKWQPHFDSFQGRCSGFPEKPFIIKTKNIEYCEFFELSSE